MGLLLLRLLVISLPTLRLIVNVLPLRSPEKMNSYFFPSNGL